MLVRSISLLFAGMLVLGGCGRQFTEADLNVAEIIAAKTFAEPFELKVEDRVLLGDSGIELSFPFVSEDTRCPSGVNCVDNGIATIVLRTRDTDGTFAQIVLKIPGLVTTPYDANAFVPHLQYQIKLLALRPYPVAGVATDGQDYRATLLVEER